MRVLFLISNLHLGGAEGQLVVLSKGLAQAGHQPMVAVAYADGERERDLIEAGVPLVSLRKRGPLDLAFLQRFVRVAQAFRPDVVHPYLSISNEFAALLRPALGGARLVWGLRSAHMDMSRYGVVSRLCQWLEPHLSGVADAVIVNSEAGRVHALQRGFRPERLHVVHNGIDTARFRWSAAARARFRNQWGVGDEVLLGIVGRLDPVKDHPLFLRAAALAAAGNRSLRFVVVGGGPARYLEELKALAAGLGMAAAVRWEGAQTDVAGVYSALDALVLSSQGESFPNVVAEAMACGTPCIATDVGDVRGIVGETGIVVPPSSPAALAEAMQRFAALPTDERAGLGLESRRVIEASYSIPALVRATLRVFTWAGARDSGPPPGAERPGGGPP